MKYREGMQKEVGKHDYCGKFFESPFLYCHDQVSVGIFQWVPKWDGNGMKKSAVKYRIKANASIGYPPDYEEIFKRASELCKMMDIGWEPEQKSEIVR